MARELIDVALQMGGDPEEGNHLVKRLCAHADEEDAEFWANGPSSVQGQECGPASLLREAAAAIVSLTRSKLDQTKDLVRRRREIAALKTPSSPTREDVARAIFDAMAKKALSFDECSQETRDYWLAAADAVLNLFHHEKE